MASNIIKEVSKPKGFVICFGLVPSKFVSANIPDYNIYRGWHNEAKDCLVKNKFVPVLVSQNKNASGVVALQKRFNCNVLTYDEALKELTGNQELVVKDPVQTPIKTTKPESNQEPPKQEPPKQESPEKIPDIDPFTYKGSVSEIASKLTDYQKNGICKKYADYLANLMPNREFVRSFKDKDWNIGWKDMVKLEDSATSWARKKQVGFAFVFCSANWTEKRDGTVEIDLHWDVVDTLPYADNRPFNVVYDCVVNDRFKTKEELLSELRKDTKRCARDMHRVTTMNPYCPFKDIAYI